MRAILESGFSQLDLACSDEACGRFKAYYDFLTERNAVMNLTAISGEENVARLHFLDCAALCSFLELHGKALIDVGSGAGFPGLPLKIIEPDLKLTLLDSHQKRVTFLDELCQRLGFSDVSCIAARAEEAAPDIGGSFDIAVSRAVARLNILCELCMPFVHVGGFFVAMKGPDCSQELEEAGNAVSVLGGRLERVCEYIIPGTDIKHSAVIIKKIRPGSKLYPRAFGQIKKKPL